jgi:hypothetical protein
MSVLRWSVDERHCLERVIDENGVVEGLIGVLDSVKKDVFLNRRCLMYIEDIGRLVKVIVSLLRSRVNSQEITH